MKLPNLLRTPHIPLKHHSSIDVAMTTNKPDMIDEWEQMVGFMVSASIERRGLVKVPKISITDGHDTWELGVANTFTITELKARFPFFFKENK